MSYNYELHQKSLRGISKQLIGEAIFLAISGGITSAAPLGFSGDNIMLFSDPHFGEKRRRKSVVSLRNHSGGMEMLITDTVGNFIFCGKFDIDLGVDFIHKQHWDIFNKCKNKIETELPRLPEFKNITDASNCDAKAGFTMLRSWQMLGHDCLL